MSDGAPDEVLSRPRVEQSDGLLVANGVVELHRVLGMDPRNGVERYHWCLGVERHGLSGGFRAGFLILLGFLHHVVEHLQVKQMRALVAANIWFIVVVALAEFATIGHLGRCKPLERPRRSR